MMDRGYSEELSCEKSYPMMYSFLHLSCFQRSWGILDAALIFTGQFAAEWCIYIWIWYKKQLFWLKHLNLLSTDMYFVETALSYRSTLPSSRSYLLASEGSELEVTCIRSCMLFCVYIPTSEDVWVGWVSLRPFWNVWSCFEGFWTIVFACDRLK